MTESTATGWYCVESRTSANQQVGPLTWEELYSRRTSGALRPDDLVWHPALPQWVAAAQVPGLFAAAQPVTPAEPQPASQPATQPTAIVENRGLSKLLPWLIPLIALILVGGGLGTYFGFLRDGANTGDIATESTTVSETTSTTESDAEGMGVAESKAPDRARLIESSTWGEVPANQICVVLVDGKSHDDAERLAQALGGSVAGEIEFIKAYLIETAGSAEADLTAALEQAGASPAVESAFANQQTYSDTEIWGVQQSPLSDPIYGDGRGKGFELIGAPKAWTYVRGSGLPLWNVHVGVIDNGLYPGTGEFEGSASVTFPDQAAGKLTSREQYKNDDTGVSVDDPSGSHGTMVTGMIGADPNNGGTTGVASPVLGDHLTISFINKDAGQYGNPSEVTPDPNDPTKYVANDGKSYAFGTLVAVTKQIEDGAKIINCSWGNDWEHPDQATAAAYKKFFEKMSAEHPDVLFVCSAGNDGLSRDGSKRFPSGLILPNMITVGNVMNDGTKAKDSNMANTTPGQEYEVTLAAPGEQVVQGVGPDGKPANETTVLSNGLKFGGGGTSAAAPQVAAAAAILSSLNPDLTAGEIKDILSRTARSGPAELGGKILAVDQAVLEVINQQREKQGLAAVTAEDLEKGGVVDAVAISQATDGDWTVKGIIESLPSVAGAEVTISATSGCEIEGETSQTITTPGEIVWAKVHVPGDMAKITITREDNGASSVITFEQIDLNGTWTGTITFTSFTIDPNTAPTEGDEGCGLAIGAAIMEKLMNVPIPMTMDITANEDGTGTSVWFIDLASVLQQMDTEGQMQIDPMEPTTVPFTYSGQTLTFTLAATQGATSSVTGTVSESGGVSVMNGALTSSGNGSNGAAVWTVTKQE